MPTQQPVQTFTPNEVAELTGIAAHNVRRWAEYHAIHLSDSANPSTGMVRRFTGRDIEVLKHVDSLRKLGLTVPVINEQLKGITFAEVDTEATEAIQTAQESPQAPVLALQAIEEHYQALEKRIEARLEGLQQARQEDKQAQRDYQTGYNRGLQTGVLIMLGVLIVGVLLAYMLPR